jgi:hypothetical protein
LLTRHCHFYTLLNLYCWISQRFSLGRPWHNVRDMSRTCLPIYTHIYLDILHTHKHYLFPWIQHEI